MATLLLGGAGALIGSAFGGPAGARTGWAIGTVLGSWIEASNQPKTEVGKLSDLRYSGSAYGVPLPRIWGRGRVGGNVIWLKQDLAGNHLVEHSRKVGGGKGGGGGGGKQYYYSATFAVAACVGSIFAPDPTDPLGGSFIERSPVVKKIYADDVLIWDSGASATANVTILPGTELQSPDPIIIAASGTSAGDTPAYRGVVYAVFDDLNLEQFSNRIPNFSFEIETDAVTLGHVVSDIARSVGIPAAYIDVSEAEDSVTGFVDLGGSSAQSLIDQLLSAYGYDLVEVDGQIRTVKRGGAESFTITGDLDAAGTDGGFKPTSRRRAMETDLPGKMEVQYFDSEQSFQQGTQSETRQTGGNTNSRSVSVSLSLTGTEARQMAGRLLDQAWSEFETYDASVLPELIGVCPGDVGIISTPSGDVRVRVTSAVLAPLGEIALSMVEDGASVVTQSTSSGSGSSGGLPPVAVYDTEFVAWSGIEARDQDQEYPGFYVAASGPEGWQGCSVYYSLDGGANYVLGPSIGGRSVFGQATTALSSAGAVADDWDVTNIVRVDVGDSGGELGSAAESSVLAGENQAILGGEIIGFQSAALITSGVYDLSNIRRGERSSPMTGHAIGDLFVEMTDAVVRVSVPDEFIGETIQVKCVSKFQSVAAATAKPVVISEPTPSATQSAIDALNTEIVYINDFFNGVNNTWEFIAVSGTGAAMANVSGDLYHPGIAEMRTGTTATGRVGYRTTGNAIVFGSGDITFEAVVRLATVTGADAATLVVGFTDNDAGEPADGPYFLADMNSTLPRSNWILKSSQNSTRTTVDSGIVAAFGTWFHLKVSVDRDRAAAKFWINGVLVGTITTNIPANTSARATGFGATLRSSAGTVSKVVALDLFKYRYAPAGNRY